MKRIFWGVGINLLVVLLISSGTLHALNGSKVIRKATNLIEQGYYLKALEKLNPYIEKDSTNTDVNLLASICYLELHQADQALRLIDKSSADQSCIDYYKALSYYSLEKFDEALSLLDGVEEINCFHERTKEELLKIVKFAERKYRYSKGFLVRNFGLNINSKDREYCAVMLNKFDSVLFTSRKSGDQNVVAKDGLTYESIFMTAVDMNQNWSTPERVELDIHSRRTHNATAQVIADGKELILYRNGDLVIAKKEKDKWTVHDQLLSTNMGQNETHCFVTEDQKIIFFSSDFLSYGNDLDLFMTRKLDDGSWSEPEPIEALNTPMDEDAPYISADGTFYFSSRGHNSIGGFDVFSTKYDPETNSWAPIENLGHPINSVADDIYFNTYGKVGYISSSRVGGEGMLDLYQVLLFNKIKLHGKIMAEQSGKPIPGASIDVTYDEWFLRGYSDYEGKYEMFVPINKDMQISIHKDTVDLHKGNYIVKVSFGAKNENEYDFFAADLDLYSLEGPSIRADILNPSDTVTINLRVRNSLGKNSIISSIPDSREEAWLDSLNAMYNEMHINDSLLFNPEHIIKKVVDVDSVVAKVYFAFDGFILQDSAKAQLTACIEKLGETDYDRLEICGYTDAVGTDMYNQILSIKRAESVSNFLIDRGVTVDKMVIKGLGEQNLLEEQQGKSALNRRVELIIRRSAHTSRVKEEDPSVSMN